MAKIPIHINRLFDKTFLFVGQTGSAKSTIINAMMNQSTDRDALHVPAPATLMTKNLGGCTRQVKFYYDLPSESLFIDTPGFGDHTMSLAETIGAIWEMFRAIRVGIDVVVLCVSLTRASTDVAKAFPLLEKLFGGDALYAHAILVVTHCDNKQDPFNHDCKGLFPEELQVARFERKVSGSFLCQENYPDFDETLRTEHRDPFLRSIVQACHSVLRVNLDPITRTHTKLQASWSLWERFKETVKVLFGFEPCLEERRKKMLSMEDRLFVQPDECPICLEKRDERDWVIINHQPHAFRRYQSGDLIDVMIDCGKQ